MGAIDAVEAKVRAKAKLPRNLAHIRNVNSIIAVGSKIVQETNLISAQDNKNIDKEKIIKYN